MNHVKLIVERNSVANQLQLTYNTATHTTKETKLQQGFIQRGGALGFPTPSQNIPYILKNVYNLIRLVKLILCTQKTMHLR